MQKKKRHDMVQRQPIEIWWMHRKHLLPWLTGAQKIPHWGASRQEHGLCALLTDPIWASFLCLEPLHWAPNICSWDPRAFAFEVPWTFPQECSSLILFISGPILAYHYHLRSNIPFPNRPSLSILWGIPPCPVQRLSVTSLSFHFYLPLIMMSHHLHYLSVDLAMVGVSPLPVRAGILSVLTHHCIPTSWHCPWHMVGAPYTFAKYFLKGTRDETEFLPSLDILWSPFLAQSLPSPGRWSLTIQPTPQEHREPEHPCLHADDTQTWPLSKLFLIPCGTWKPNRL